MSKNIVQEILKNLQVLSRDNSVGIVLQPGWKWIQGSILGRNNRFLFLHNVQTGPRTHAASNNMVIGSSFPGVKWPVPETDRIFPSSAEVKNSGVIPSLAHTY
jgi:hypothetical protein